MKIGKLVICIAIPVLVGFLVSYPFYSGVFTRWEAISSPTEFEQKYLAEIRANRLNDNSDKITQDGFKELAAPCDYTKVEFSIFSNDPKNIVDCVQVKHFYSDGYKRSVIVSDSDGNIWEWSFMVTKISRIGSIVGPVVGLIIGVIVLFIVNKRGKNPQMRS